MDIKEYDRITFSVEAVEVTLDNYAEVAEWCGGRVDTEKVKLVGAITSLPCIRLQGSGEKKGQEFTAGLGHYVVRLNDSFRVYKRAQFNSTFQAKRKPVYRTHPEGLNEEYKNKPTPTELADGDLTAVES